MKKIQFSYDSPSCWGLKEREDVGADSGNGPKRKLLAHALRVHENLLPDVSKSLRSATKKAGLEDEPAAFVVNDTDANAMCVPWSAKGHHDFAVVLTSGLIKLLNPIELEFVIGHELGHFMFRHFAYPEISDHDSLGDRLATLNLQRAAEISADRMGLMASGTLEAGCSAMIKTSCGLGPPHLKLNVPAILAQFRELTQEEGGHSDAVFDTHPMLAIRVRSMLRFSTTETFHNLSEKSDSGQKNALLAIDDAIRKDFDKASGFAHESWENEALAEMRLWSVLTLFITDLRLSKQEQQLLESCFGKDHARNAMSFIRLGGKDTPSTVRSRLREACKNASGISQKKIEGLFSELERLASAASGDSEDIIRCLEEIAKALRIERRPCVTPWEPEIQ